MTVYTIWDQAGESFDTTAFTGTLATEFNLSESGELTGIWVYSPSGVSALPTSCAVYDIDTSTVVSGTLNSSPSWSGAAGSGWVKCAYSGPTLSSGVNYAAAVFYDATVAFNSYSWPTTSGIIDATAGLFTTGGSEVTLPGSNAGSFTYWVDVEITVASTVTASGGVTMAAMALAGSGREAITAAGGIAMAAMRAAGTGAETGADVTASGGVTMAAMRIQGRQAAGSWSLPAFMAAI